MFGLVSCVNWIFKNSHTEWRKYYKRRKRNCDSQFVLLQFIIHVCEHRWTCEWLQQQQQQQPWSETLCDSTVPLDKTNTETTRLFYVNSVPQNRWFKVSSFWWEIQHWYQIWSYNKDRWCRFDWFWSRAVSGRTFMSLLQQWTNSCFTFSAFEIKLIRVGQLNESEYA